MIKIAICDDEMTFVDKINTLISEWSAQNQYFSVIQTFSNGQNLIYDIEDGQHYDLVILDIEMPAINGMEVADAIRRLLPNILVIFVTSHTEYALDAYELSIFRYISKADLEDKLRHAFLDAVKLIQIQQNDSYIIQNQNRLERIPCKNIMYITHEGKNSLFMTNLPNDSVYRERKTIQQVYQNLDHNAFFLIDRGCIVNLTQIISVKNNECILNGDIHLPVSQARMRPLKECLLTFWQSNL